MEIIMDCLRHGKAVPVADKSHQADLDRPLSEKGKRQGLVRREMVGKPRYDRVFATTALRTRMTAAIVANIRVETVIVIPEISLESISERGKILDVMFRELDYRPLRDWYAHPNGQHVLEHGQAGMQAIEDAAGVRGDRDRRVLVVGHSYSICACGHQAIRLPGDPVGGSLQALLDLEIGEAEGFRLTYRDGTVRRFEMLPRLPVT